MAEIGIDISKHTSKSIEEFRDKDIDLVVSVCTSSTRVACPFCSSSIIRGRPEIVEETLPRAKRYLQHGFSDPSEAEGSDEEKTAAFQRTRDDIKRWIMDHFSGVKSASE
jgi:arsenate reductase